MMMEVKKMARKNNTKLSKSVSKYFPSAVPKGTSGLFLFENR